MSHVDHNLAPRRRVNVVKKVKVNGAWQFCPAVWEANGKLKDKVRVNGHTEVHGEGVYYLEWREEGQRLREAVRERSEVRERARLKALEIDARAAGIEVGQGGSIEVGISRSLALSPVKSGGNAAEGSKSSDVRTLIFHAVDSYFKNLVSGFLASQLRVASPDSRSQLPAATLFPSVPLDPPVEQPRNEQSPASDQSQVNQNSEGKTLIAQAIDSYLKDVEPPQREQKTYDEYRSTLYRFRDNCGKLHLQDVSRDDCLGFIRYLYSIGNEARTVYNRIGIVLQLLKLHGITGILKRRDKPKYVETVREMYQPEDLEVLFKACTPDEKVRYLFFLLTGERDKEVRYTSWSDIDFNRKRVRVTAKKHLGFKPKDKEEREIPIPEALAEALKEYKTRQSGPNPHNLVFPTSEGKPDKKFENKLKRIANRAGLNCGVCVSKHDNKCSEGPHCSKWFLHKFRHTFATMCLENGVSIRTLQEWLGHTDLESTMVYLKFVRRKDIHKLLDNSELAELAANTLGMRHNEGTGEPAQ